MFDNRNYLIFNTDELSLIDFNQVLETSPDTLRYSVDGTKTFIKWDGEMPASVQSLTTSEGPYSHSEMLDVLAGPEWTQAMEEPVGD